MSDQPAGLLGARRFEYAQVDVFAEKALEGNALAIFTDARGLSAGEMQALARETNLSETTFILPRHADVEQERGVQVRIFTAQEELPFAGHPTLGTASWLHWKHLVFRGAEEIRLDLQAGPIVVRFSPPEAGRPGIFGTMQQNDPVFGEIHDAAAVADVLGLMVADLDSALPIQTVSTGLAICIVPLRSMDVAARLEIPYSRAQPYLDRVGAKFFYCITRAPAAARGVGWHARMQFYNGEDPATGSAAGCTIAYLVRHGLAGSEEPVVIQQGIEMLRPSRIHVKATLTGSTISGVFVGGRTVPVANGHLFIP